MATLVIRNVEVGLHERLRAAAAAHGRSMEEEVRQVLRAAFAPAAATNRAGFGDAMRALFEPLGGLDLPEIGRDSRRELPDFSGPDWDTERST